MIDPQPPKLLDQAHPKIRARHYSIRTEDAEPLCALIFLYGEILDQDLDRFQYVVWAKKPSKLPVVFAVDGVQAVLAHLYGACWLMASLLYGSGLPPHGVVQTAGKRH